MKIKQIATSVLLLSSLASANPWTECGIGGAIGSLVEKQPASNVIASVSNIVWDLGTTATTSAISSPDLCSNTSVAAARFINDSYATLESETAIGEGESLVALMDIMATEESARASILAEVRAEYSKVVSEESFNMMTEQQKAQSYYSVFMKAYNAHTAA